MPLTRNLLIALLLAASAPAADQASRDFEAARRAEKTGDTLQAYLLSVRAAAADSRNSKLAAYKNALEKRAPLVPQTRLEPAPLSRALAESLATLELTPGQMAEAAQALPPPSLRPSSERKSFDIRGDARVVFEQVASAFGIQVTFDGDYQSVPPFLFRVNDFTQEEALRALETATASFLVPVHPTLAMVVRDTPQRRTDTAPSMSIAVPIPERLTVQEAQELVTAVQQIMEVRRVSVDPTRHLVFLHDQVSKIKAARILFDELSRAHTQVEVEVELVSVATSSALHYGLTTPTSAPLVDFGTVPHAIASAAAGFAKYATFGGGMSFIGMGVADAAVLATATRSSSGSVLRAQISALDGQPSTLHIGDRYPIITNGYYGQTSGTGQTYTPPPTVTFQDLGLVLKVTPFVHEGGEITLDVEAEHATLGALGENNIPAISHRKYTGKIRVATGEWAVVAGLVNTTQSQDSTGLPILGRLLRRHNRSTDSTETLIVLKPRLMNLPPWEEPSPAVWVGTEAKPLTAF